MNNTSSRLPCRLAPQADCNRRDGRFSRHDFECCRLAGGGAARWSPAEALSRSPNRRSAALSFRKYPFVLAEQPTGVGIIWLEKPKGETLRRVRRTLCLFAPLPDHRRAAAEEEVISATAVTMATAEMETAASSRGAIMARLDMLAAHSLGRLPSWQEDTSLIAIRGRSCRLCVRALCKMALLVGGSL